MEEIVRLLRENNLMLRYLCSKVSHSNEEYDIKDFVMNLVANLYSNKLLNNDR